MRTGIRERLARNLSVMMGAQGITWISSFVLLYFLPRYLGTEDFGRLYLALSIKMMLGLLIDFGGSYLIAKEVARSRTVGMKILNSYIVLRVLLWVLAIGLIMLLSDLLGYSEHVHLLILVLAVGKLWEGGASALSAFFQGIERMEYPSMGGVAERVFVAFFAVIALLLGGDSLAVAVVMSAGSLIHLLVIFWFSRKFMTLNFRLNLKSIQLLGSGMPYFLFSLFSVIYYRIDAVMISSMTNESVTGWYGGAFRFFDIVMVLPLLYKTAIFPVFSRLWNDKGGTLETTIGESLRLMIILGIPTALFIFFYSAPIIDFFMDLEEYGPSVIILQIFALSIPVIYLDIILGSALMGAANRQSFWAVIGFLAILVNTGLNWLWIPWTQTLFENGGIGGAAATLVTEIFVMTCALWLLPKGYLRLIRAFHLLKPLAAGGMMLATMVILERAGLHWIPSAALGGMAYLAGLFLVRTFNSKEIRMLKSMLSFQGLKLILQKETL